MTPDPHSGLLQHKVLLACNICWCCNYALIVRFPDHVYLPPPLPLLHLTPALQG